MCTKVILLQYPCYICKEILFSSRDIMSHVICTHGFMLYERPKADTTAKSNERPPEANYEFKEYPIPKEDLDSVLVHSACPSCWYHCPTENDVQFEEHVLQAHNPQHYQGQYKDETGEPSDNQSNGSEVDELEDEYKEQNVNTDQKQDKEQNVITGQKRDKEQNVHTGQKQDKEQNANTDQKQDLKASMTDVYEKIKELNQLCKDYYQTRKRK